MEAWKEYLVLPLAFWYHLAILRRNRYIFGYLRINVVSVLAFVNQFNAIAKVFTFELDMNDVQKQHFFWNSRGSRLSVYQQMFFDL